MSGLEPWNADDTSSTLIVADTSVLINSLRIDRMELIARHARQFIVTDHIAAEATDFCSDRQARLGTALQAGSLQQASITNRHEIALFGSLAASGTIGSR